MASTETDHLAFEQRTLRLFEALLDQPLERRSSWLRQATGNDASLIEAVNALEAADRDADRISTMPPGLSFTLEEQSPPDHVGHFRIVRELGHGGMGVVYLAERDDGLFDQRVAIKVMRSALFSDEALTRFATERRMLARLEHPGVARLIDGGLTEVERPWLATEYVEGSTIDRACQGKGIDRRIDLFLSAARAVQFAHGRYSDVPRLGPPLPGDLGKPILEH